MLVHKTHLEEQRLRRFVSRKGSYNDSSTPKSAKVVTVLTQSRPAIAEPFPQAHSCTNLYSNTARSAMGRYSWLVGPFTKMTNATSIINIHMYML